MWRRADTIESWSWAGCDGKKADVTVYSGAPYVELILCGRRIGRKKTCENKAVFHRVAYQPGTLEARALHQDGRPASRSRLVSAGPETVIRLTPEASTLRANGQDLCFLNIDLADNNGITKVSRDQQLTVQVSGAGSLQAFGSARPEMSENFYSTTHTTYYGKALAVIRAGYAPGTIRVEVSGQGLEKQVLEIPVTAENSLQKQAAVSTAQDGLQKQATEIPAAEDGTQKEAVHS